MLYIVYNHKGEVLDVTNETGPHRRRAIEENGEWSETRNDWKTLDDAIRATQEATEHTGETFFATDSGRYVMPRYDIARMPKVGDEVSRGFNGDYYPCGMITKITPTASRIETSSGHVFTRRKGGAEHMRHSAKWLDRGNTFALVRGLRDERNPHF